MFGRKTATIKKENQKMALGLTMTQLLTVAQALAMLALLGILQIHLLSALVAGLLIYQLIQFSVPLFGHIGVVPRMGKTFALIVIVTAIVAIIYISVIGVTSLLTNGPESLVVLLQKMADVMDTAINHLPLWIQDYIPINFEDWQNSAAQWLRSNANEVSHFGRDVGTILIHILMGLVIGGMIAFSHDVSSKPVRGPLAQLLIDRAQTLDTAFRRIVFSQVRISALNTLFTSIFLLLILPAAGIHLPLVKTMLVVTFLVGLLPVIGNLISNTVIVLVGLSVSSTAAISAFVFLVVIHKLEYFMNARIIGFQIRARAWEILLAMLVMEACFGIAGLIAAPIYYAYLKDELSTRGLV